MAGVVQRIVAVAVAVGLVVGALVVRSRLDDDDATGPSATDAATPELVVCDDSLAAACRAAFPATDVELVIEPLAATIARLTAADGADDGGADDLAWVTLAPMPELVDEERRRALLDDAFTTVERVATSPLVAVTSVERAAALEAACAPELTLRCIGDRAGQPWADLGAPGNLGTVRPSHEEPDDRARGALTYAWLATAYAGGPQLDARSAELSAWASTVERAAPAVSGGTSPTPELIVRQGAFDIALTTEADATTAGAADPRYRVLYPAPMVQAEVVVAGGADAIPADLIGPLRSALVDQGWQPADGAPTGGGLPGAGVVQALRTVSWNEVGR